MNTVFALIMILGYGMDGKAIDTGLRFPTMAACEAARQKVKRENTIGATCVENVVRAM